MPRRSISCQVVSRKTENFRNHTNKGIFRCLIVIWSIRITRRELNELVLVKTSLFLSFQLKSFRLKYSVNCLHETLSIRYGVYMCLCTDETTRTYQILLPIIYMYSFKGRFRVRVGVDIKKNSNHINKMLVAQSDR